MPLLKYVILQFDCMNILIKEVNEWMKLGWEPVGGVSVSSDSEGKIRWYFQSIVYKQERQ